MENKYIRKYIPPNRRKMNIQPRRNPARERRERIIHALRGPSEMQLVASFEDVRELKTLSLITYSVYAQFLIFFIHVIDLICRNCTHTLAGSSSMLNVTRSSRTASKSRTDRVSVFRTVWSRSYGASGRWMYVTLFRILINQLRKKQQQTESNRNSNGS